MNAKLKKFIVAIGGAAVIGGSLIAVQGTSSAEAVTGFRLSNFSATTANLCVTTDVETKCSGEWTTGKSEVFDVRFNSPDRFKCAVSPLGGQDEQTVNYFSRNEYKECKINGTIFDVDIILVRLDGTESTTITEPI